MYHCNACLYFSDCDDRIKTAIKKTTPLEQFSHRFLESAIPDREMLAQADVIFADLSENGKEALGAILSGKKREAELIVLGDKACLEALTEEELSEISDIWRLPLGYQETIFRFSRWQQRYKEKKDFWKTVNYLDTMINSVPDLIWYKDKNGAHVKVNKSFCKAVNKTMEQVEGRGHNYIWDIEPDEYARGEYICMESEYEVMEKRKTCVFDEKVKIGNEMRQLKTYKSPLFDLDGSVMGTVGIAMDVTQERRYEDMIIKNANTDFLTGLYNRRYIYQFIEQEIRKPITIYYLDLDNFKHINDKYGHLEGDRALALTAEVLQGCMPDCTIARLGGDEFLVVQIGILTREEAKDKGNWLEDQLNQAFTEHPHFVKLSVSIGVAQSISDQVVIDELLGEADAYMYREKKRKKFSLKDCYEN